MTPPTPTPPEEKTFTISFCQSIKTNVITLKTLTWDDLAASCRHKHKATAKNQVPLFAPAEFRDGKRSKDTAVAISIFVLDVDNPQVAKKGEPAVTMDEISIALIEKGLKHILASSWSHTEECPKFRVLIPLAYPIKVQHWRRWAPAALEATGLDKFKQAMDMSCLKNTAAIFYWASAPDGDPWIVNVPGELLEVPVPSSIKLDFSHIRFHKDPGKDANKGDFTTLDVVRWFSDHDAYIKAGSEPGLHIVVCPWTEHHTRQAFDTASCIREGEPGRQWPSFQCFHDHCSGRTIKDVLEAWSDANKYCARAWTPLAAEAAIARGEVLPAAEPGAGTATSSPTTAAATTTGEAKPASAPLGPLPSDGNKHPYVPDPAYECKDGFPTSVVELLKRYVYVSGMDKILDRKTGGFMSCSGLRNTLAGALFETRDEGFRKIDYFAIHGRRKCTSDQIIFDPTTKVDFPSVNLFTGFLHDAADPLPVEEVEAKVEATLLLLYYLCGDDTEYVLHWLAYPLIYPGAKMRSSLIIHGAQGLGKNLIFERAMVKAYGHWGRLIDQRDLDGAFNGWVSKKLFIVADEVATDKRKTDTSNLLKSWITGGTISVNEKNLPIREEENHANFVFLSNNAVPIFVDEDDRRYCVIRVPAAPMDPGVYTQVASDIYETKGLAWYQYLRSLDVAPEFVREPVPQNKAKAELKQFCRGSVDLYLDEWACIDEDTGEQDLEAALKGENDMRVPYGPASIGPLYQGYRIFCKWNGIGHPVSKRSFGIRGPGGRNYTKWRTNAYRYVVPPEVIVKNHWEIQTALETFETAIKEYADRRPESGQ